MLNYSTKTNYQTAEQFKKRKNFNQLAAYPHVSLDKEVIHTLQLTGKEKILDVGCGPVYTLILKIITNT